MYYSRYIETNTKRKNLSILLQNVFRIVIY
jgi:hypothetical protein